MIVNVLLLNTFMSDTSKRKQESRVTYGSEVDWTEIQRVERDICLLYHQLADYSYIMGDLCFGEVFSLPYWEYLQVEELEPDQRRFMCDGCLVMLYAMALDVLGDSGNYLTMDRDRYNAIKRAVDCLEPNGHDTDRLASALKKLFQEIDRYPSEMEGSVYLMDEVSDMTWVHEHFVQRYFTERASRFPPI